MADAWSPCRSTAVEAYRYRPEDAVLQIVFRSSGQVYDYPCDVQLYERFLVAESKGRFVEYVLKPYAREQGWSPRPRQWSRPAR